MMKTRARLLSILLALTILLTLLAACGGGGNAPAADQGASAAPKQDAPSASDGDGGKITLRGMHWTSSTAEQDKYNEGFKRFNEQFPDIEISFEWFPEGYAEKLIALFASNDSPDFFNNYVGDLGDRVTKGFMAPLTPYYEADGFDSNDDLMQNAVVRYKGDVYGILPNITPQVMYYNKDIFDTAGVAYPTDDWTWKDMQDAAAKLSVKEGDKLVQYGFQCDEYNRVWLSQYWSNGGVCFDDEENPTKPTFNNPTGVESAQYLMDMVQSLGIAPPPGVQGVLGYRDNFTNGIVGIILDGSWMNSQFAQKEDLNYGVALVPKGSVKRGGWMAPSAFAMSTKTKHPDEVWTFLKYWFSYDNSLYTSGYGDAVESSGVPVWKSAYSDPNWNADEQVTMIGRQAEFAQTEMAFQYYGRWFWDYLNAGLQEMVANKDDPAAALDLIAERTQRDVLDEIDR